MQSIRNDFISKITQSATIAVGVSVVLQIGITKHQQTTANYPNAMLFMGAGPPETPIRTIQLAPTHQQIQDILSNNRNILFELYLTELIQHWFDFLGAIYKKAITDNLSGAANKYEIPKTKIKVDFNLRDSILKQSLIDSASGDFDFLRASEKLKTVEKILGIDLSSVAKDKELIRENIQIRNILQHRGGIVSAEDLHDLGITSIKEDHGNSTKAIIADHKVTRTGFDIENLANSFIKVSNTLIP